MSPSLRRGLREAAIALVAGAAIAASPFVPSRPGLKEGAFVVVALLVYLVRRRRAAGVADDHAADPAAKKPVPWLAIACLLGLAVLYEPTFFWMYRQWTINIWLNTHGIFVPPLVLYLGWIVLRRDTDDRPDASPWGFAFVIPALLLYILDLSLRTRFLSAISVALLLPGLSLLFLGAKRTRDLRLPLVIAIFMIPIPFLVSSVLFLREITTEGVVFLLRLFGVPVYSTGTLIHLTWGPFRVSEACSGLATFYSSIAIATVFSGLTDSRWRRVALMSAAIPLAIAANIVRVIILVLLCKWFGNELLDTPIHEGSGAATFVVVFLVLQQIGNPRQLRRSLT